MSEIFFSLPDQEKTLDLGAALAGGLPAGQGGHILLKGPPGAGKTTLVRGLASALPGHEQAEVSSPSFNMLNIYPTEPPLAHIDLYRLTEGADPDESILEFLDQTRYVTLLEWPERLPAALWPASRLLVEMIFQPPSGRIAGLTAREDWAGALLQRLSASAAGGFKTLPALTFTPWS